MNCLQFFHPRITQVHIIRSDFRFYDFFLFVFVFPEGLNAPKCIERLKLQIKNTPVKYFHVNDIVSVRCISSVDVCVDCYSRFSSLSTLVRDCGTLECIVYAVVIRVEFLWVVVSSH